MSRKNLRIYNNSTRTKIYKLLSEIHFKAPEYNELAIGSRIVKINRGEGGIRVGVIQA